MVEKVVEAGEIDERHTLFVRLGADLGVGGHGHSLRHLQQQLMRYGAYIECGNTVWQHFNGHLTGKRAAGTRGTHEAAIDMLASDGD